MNKPSQGKTGFPPAHRKPSCMLILVFFLAVALLAAACGPSTETLPPTTAPPAAAATDLPPAEVPLSQHLRFTHLTTDDGLSEGRVWGITQDSKGFMWFTSWEGPVSYTHLTLPTILLV